MSLSPSTLQAIQQAGLGLYQAHQAVSADVQTGGRPGNGPDGQPVVQPGQ